jgi:hypothetical protein
MWSNRHLTPEQFFVEKLSYDSETGVLTWKEKVRNAEVGDVAGSTSVQGYRVVYANGAQFKAHRVAWLLYYGEWPGKYIDHINGIRDDNRIVNLRDVAPSVNSQNLKSATARSSTGRLGVYKARSKWKASICTGGKRTHLGLFKTIEQAEAAYLDAKRRLHEGCSI